LNKVIEVQGLKKHYGDVYAVKGLDFYVEKGKLFAFLGPNGAGKSTTINMITTLLSIDEGVIQVDGHTVGVDDVWIRDRIGIVFQDHFLDALLTVKENLTTRASFYGGTKAEIEERVKMAMDVVEIADLANRPYGKLSGGQRRRTDIARALVNQPDILFLDEPTTGLDPQTRKNVWETIQKLQKSLGMTVFLTTHYMEEAAVADYVVVIDNGVIAAKGTPNELKDRYSTDSLRFFAANKAKAKDVLTMQGVAFREENGEIIVDLDQTVDSLPLLDALKGNLLGFQVLNGTMDDVFIRITGKEMR
jgi:multidrug/hemolysin transport system ATP-binding protein